MDDPVTPILMNIHSFVAYIIDEMMKIQSNND